MSPREILFDANGLAIGPTGISERIDAFGDAYSDAVKEIIAASEILDNDGEVFIRCASRILSSFGTTRPGPFHEHRREKLLSCWQAVGADLKEINDFVRNSGLSRARVLLELAEPEREKLISKIWLTTKKLLPFTMGENSYGLVGASKILFSVLPEIVLPVDNAEWLHVFKTVDLGDVLHDMVSDIQEWEKITGRQLNDLDRSKRLTTLPSVYNVMSMRARP
jgi:hypothetical protein